MVTDGYETYCGDQFIMYINIESLCCIPKTNTILYANYTSIKKKRKWKRKNSNVKFYFLPRFFHFNSCHVAIKHLKCADPY